MDKVTKDLAEALELSQFGFDHRRCSVCAGWNVGPNGETDKVHTATCPVGLALKAYRAQLEREEQDKQNLYP